MNVWMPIIMFESSRELVATAFDISDSAKNDRLREANHPNHPRRSGGLDAPVLTASRGAEVASTSAPLGHVEDMSSVI